MGMYCKNKQSKGKILKILFLGKISPPKKKKRKIYFTHVIRKQVCEEAHIHTHTHMTQRHLIPQLVHTKHS